MKAMFRLGLRIGAFLFVAMVLNAGSCGSLFWGEETAYREETKEFDTSGLDRLSLVTRSGRIEIVGRSEEKMEVTFVRRGRAGSKAQAQSLLDKIRLVERREGSTIKWAADFPKGQDPDQFGVDYLVALPARFSLDLHVQNGSIETRQMEGNVLAKSQNGPVSIFGARNPVRVVTFRGNVSLSGNPSNIDISTQSGKVQLQLASLKALERESRIQTHDGDVELGIPAGFSAQLHLFSNAGKIKVSTPGRWEIQESFEYRGIVGIGGTRLLVESHSGVVSVQDKK